MKKCPFCAELIQNEAIVCRFCNRELIDNIQDYLQYQSNGFDILRKDKKLVDAEQFIVTASKKLIESHGEIPLKIIDSLERFTSNPAVTFSQGMITSRLKKIESLSDAQMKELANISETINIQTALLAAGVGVEYSKRTISDEDLQTVLPKLSNCYKSFWGLIINHTYTNNQDISAEMISLQKTIFQYIDRIVVNFAKLGELFGNEISIKLNQTGKSNYIEYLLNAI